MNVRYFNLKSLLGALFVAAASAAAVPVSAAPAETASAEVLNVEIPGKVTDGATGAPLAGARISVVNSTATVSTGDDGAFLLKAPSSDVTLSVEFPGYVTVTVPAAGRRTVSVRMQRAGAASLYDAGVTGSASKAVASQFPIGETVADRSVADLQGDLLAISRSGMPGSGHTVYLAGLHSINTSSQPLYVVDGVVWTADGDVTSTVDGHVNNPLALISPDDIENIYVLRNGQAIYGAKGGNGVVVIETKRARSEATEIEAFARMGWRGSVKSIPVMDAGQYRSYASDVIRGKYANTSMVDRLSFLNDDPSSSQYYATHNNTDWLDLTTRTGLLMNYGVSVRGGDDRALYAFMLGYTKNDGSVKETSMDRINVRFNSDIKLWKGADLRFDIAYAQVNYKLRDDGLNAGTSPYYLSMIKSPLYHPNVLTAGGKVTVKYSDTDELGVSNPMSVLDMGVGESRNYRFNLNASPRYRFNDRLAIIADIDYTFDKIKENSFIPDYGTGETEFVNNTGETYFTARNSVENLMVRHTTFNAGIHVDWTPVRNTVDDLALRLGYRYQNDTFISSLGYGYNTSSDYINDLGNTTTRFTDGFDTEWRNMAWYFTGEYKLWQRYILGVEAALESSSRFGKDAPDALHIGGVSWGIFPSVNAAWLISSESFMAGARFVNLLKLRAGFDMAGNDNLPFFANRTYFASTHFLGNAYVPVLTNIGNDRLKWETTSTLRAGIDASLFNDRWQFSFDIYKSKTRDLLVSKTLTDVAGVQSYWTNGGDLENNGINFSTTFRAVNTRDWKLDLGASVGHYKNKVTKLDDGDFVTDICGGSVLTSVGNPVGVFYGYKTDGVFSTAADAAAADLKIRNANGSYTAFAAGDMKFVDNTPDGVINDADRQIIGDPNPDIYGNFNFRLSWKNLTLGSIFTYSVGNDVYNALRANLESGSDIFNQSTAMAGRWVAEGQNASIPRATFGDPMGNARFSDRWIEDGSYLKWKTLSLEYRLPISNPYIQGLTFSFAVHNLCTWTKYLGPDPEFSFGSSPLYMGVDAGLIPSTRDFNFGVKINL